MTDLSPQRLKSILLAARNKRVAVIGDFMLDRHLKGTVRRISPEAPVPVVDIESETSGLGGAGNVITNLAGLGVVPMAFGVIGSGRAGETLLDHVRQDGGNGDGLIVSTDRKTSEKIRIIADDQHVVRADRETASVITRGEEDALLNAVRMMMDSIDAVILQDYNKGVLTPRVISSLMELFAKSDTPVLVDPKFDNFFAFKNAHLFKPNVKEVERAMGVRAETDEELLAAGHKLFRRLTPDVLMVTRGERGMTLFTNAGRVDHIPTRARDVHDVSGAGDTVISTFAVAELGGATPLESATAANLAGGIVCGHVGVVSISKTELLDGALTLDSSGD